jgi:serine/threonine protein kinase
MTSPRHVDAKTGERSANGSHIPISAHGDPRVSAALEEYLAALDAGHAPPREEFLVRYPEIARALSECLDGLAMIHAASLSMATALPDAPDLPGPELGDFRILREIGRGGMGIVYEAVQVSLGRRVALKILSSMASPDSRQRFRVEAQAAAHLHHPHIVPIFAVGCERGIDYYAMQYIEGRTLAAVIDELRAQADTERLRNDSPGESKPAGAVEPDSDGGSSGSTLVSSGGSSNRRRAFFESIARLGVQAAEALEHAHNLGVLHRDIKPSNLILDGEGDLWVTDFGLARFRDGSSLTETGDVIGTLRYMSPEQAHGRRVLIDQRVDLYSLGATLYELATLRPLFEEHERQALLSKITFDEPVPPRKLNPAIPRDLETILLKALAKDVRARYGDAREMRDDLTRFLENRPVHAKRPSLLDRAAKWSRRHRTALAAMLAAFVASLAIGSVLLWRAREQTLDALAESKASNRRERAALQSFLRVADPIMLQAMGALSEKSVASPYKRTVALRPLADEPNGFYRRALVAYEATAEEYRSNPETRVIAAEVYRRVAFVRMILRYSYKNSEFLNADAEAPYRESIRLWDAEIAASPGKGDLIRSRTEVSLELALMLKRIGAIGRAEPLFRDALTVREDLLPSPYTRKFIRQRLAEIRTDWAISLGRDRDAAKLLEEMIATDPGNADALNGLALLLCLRPESPVHDPDRAVTLARRAVRAESANAALWITLAMAQLRAGHLNDAQTAVERTMKLHEPEESDWLILAMIEHRRGHTAEARQYFDRAQKQLANANAKNPNVTALAAEVANLLGPK